MKKKLIFAALSVLILSSCEKNEEQNTTTIAPEEQNSEQSLAHRSLPENRTDGTDQGYFWTMWRAKDKNGKLDITFPSSKKYSGNFEISYKNVKNVVGGKGWEKGTQRTINYNIGHLSGNPEFVGVYGWTQNPDVEYYVSEKGSGGTDNAGNGYKFVKSYKSEGNSYRFYEKKISGLPCALQSGPCNFWRYKSIRQNRSANNKNQKINMRDHVRIWRQNGSAGGRRKKWGTFVQYQVFGIESFSNQEKATARINATIW